MQFSEVVEKRYSCRRFKDIPVDPDIVKKIVAQAQRAPSWGNTQPWKVYVAGGETALAIREGLVEAHNSGADETPEIEMPATFADVLMNRYRQLGKALFKVLSIGREDKDKRLAHYANNFNAFGATALVYVTVPAGQTSYVCYDAGAFVAQLCLAATDAGLATVVLAALARFPQVVRRHLPLGEDERLIIGVALGHPEDEADVNQFRSTRDPLDEILTLRGF